MEREAELEGPQIKVLEARVVPVDPSHGEWGIPLQSGTTRPFEVLRMWSAPAGHYAEQWFVVNPATREVLYESILRESLIHGLQSPTEISDRVEESIRLDPGTYHIVFSLGRWPGGELEIEAFEVPTQQAA